MTAQIQIHSIIHPFTQPLIHSLKKETALSDNLFQLVETQGFEPWSEHGHRQAFYMFSQSDFSWTVRRLAYLSNPLSSVVLSGNQKPISGRLSIYDAL